MYLLSTHVFAYVRKSECARRMHSSVRSCARLCMSARASAREGRERRRNPTARPLDVIHHVGMYMCECMDVHMDVRVESLQVSVHSRVGACARASGAAHARAHETCTPTCVT